MEEQTDVTPVRKQLLDGVRFAFTVGSFMGDWEPTKAVREMYDSGLLYARLAHTEPTEGDMHFLYDCILSALMQMYPQYAPQEALDLMKQALTEPITKQEGET